MTLFNRPRRFGKTLNMSMLKSFFEIGTDKTLFDGLYISGNKALCDEHMGEYPVIFLSLKGVDELDFSSAKRMLCTIIDRGMRLTILLTICGVCFLLQAISPKSVRSSRLTV